MKTITELFNAALQEDLDDEMGSGLIDTVGYILEVTPDNKLAHHQLDSIANELVDDLPLDEGMYGNTVHALIVAGLGAVDWAAVRTQLLGKGE